MHEVTSLRVGLITSSKPLETRLCSGVNHGCEITPFPSIREFPGKLKATEFAAILLDVEEEGITLEHAANAVKWLSDAEPHVPVMALARPRRGFGARLKAAGADEVVPWHIEPEQLLEALQQVLAARAEQQESERQRRSAERYQFRELIGNSESSRGLTP